METMEEAQNLSDILARVQRLEARKETRQTPVSTPRSGKVYFDSHVVLWDESISANKDWTDSGSRKYVPETATEVILWCGIDDTTQGVGTSKMEARVAGKVFTIGEIREPGSGDAIFQLGQCMIPVQNGRFDFRVTLAGGATALNYKIELVGYVE